mmetsp:Transcript_115880/g.334656  ORF Transcript_115880/g.334656 Transcript_115880/m.334656 type:complete len:282 (+) Transcript_115880:295-1140(+)
MLDLGLVELSCAIDNVYLSAQGADGHDTDGALLHELRHAAGGGWRPLRGLPLRLLQLRLQALAVADQLVELGLGSGRLALLLHEAGLELVALGLQLLDGLLSGGLLRSGLAVVGGLLFLLCGRCRLRWCGRRLRRRRQSRSRSALLPVPLYGSDLRLVDLLAHVTEDIEPLFKDCVTEGLRQVVRGAGFKCLLRCRVLWGAGGQHHHWKLGVREPALVADLLDDLEARHARHHHVKEHQRRELLAGVEVVERVLAAHDAHDAPVRTQTLFEDLLVDVVVVH